jgi:protein-disulfide isomerase
MRSNVVIALGAGLIGAGLLAWRMTAKAPELAADSPFPAPLPSASPAAARDTTIWLVPVYPDDPVKGAKQALVTIVAFSEFESPSGKRAVVTLDRLLAAHPNDLRLVWKDNPVAFHPRARAVALFARHVYAQKGNEGFWSAHDLLFASPKLGRDQLRDVAKSLGLTWDEREASQAAERFGSKVDQNLELGGDVQVRGIPHFFINGVRLPGAKPLEEFEALVRVELDKARALVARGVPRERVYDEIMKGGKGPPPLAKKEVPAPSANSPSKGAAAAPIVIQEWAAFPCASCARTSRTLAELEQEYRGKVKVVWRHLASESNAGSFLAAQAAQEAFSQHGNAGFWRFHDRLLELVAGGRIERDVLDAVARDNGLDLHHFKSALDSGKHKARVLADAKVGAAAGIASAPAFVVNGFYLLGDPPNAAFRKVINLALRPGR